MITLKNEFVTAKFNEKGAELKSLVSGDKEYIWCGDEKFWASSAPVLFPICGGLKDDEYYYNGKKYTMKRHGFVRNLLFEVEKASDSAVTFLLRSNDETKEQYPFDFELRVSYALEGKSLKINYNVKNCSGGKMYFSIGSHEGYYCPEGIEEYDVLLPAKETLDATKVDGPILSHDTERIIENDDKIALKSEYFTIDALVFKDIKARSVVLKHRNSERALKLSFEGCDYFLIWTKVGAPYVCLEPWCGVSDSVDTDKKLETKEGIMALEVGNSFEKTHTIEILG